MNKVVVRKTVKMELAEDISTYFQKQTGLSKSKIKDAMIKGAAWKTPARGKRKRIRRATSKLKKGDRVELYYDPRILSLKPPSSDLLHDLNQYSVWNKPAGLMTQGTDYGDHCSLLRQVELFFHSTRKVYLVHRIDRETQGVIVIAHSEKAAGALSRLFQKRAVKKEYRAVVLGKAGEINRTQTIDMPLDGKESVTHYQMEQYDPESDTSTVQVWIQTGRTHQIRRHFDMIGHPIIGDPQYGKGNKNSDQGLQLTAESLEFRCPFQKNIRKFRLETR